MYATSGLPGIEYLVGDDEMIRPDEIAHFSEEVLCLPVSYLTFTVDYPVPPVTPPPCMSQGYFTYGSLVTQYKITPQVFDAWSEILRAVVDARLLLANSTLKSPHNRRYVLEQFQRRDVDPSRVTLLGPADHATYLRYYDQIDLALDAFPYNGGTTTMEAIWQGVPVLTFDGDRWISRTSQTLLRRSHLGQFVATDVDDMIARGIHWGSRAEAWPELAEMRVRMREELAKSSACDTPALARGMEQLYKQIWLRATNHRGL
jgi:predicted O-linked N-acetylglucosamine transferase (SPINDLY family)